MSVVVPVRNRRLLLRRMLDALAVQTFADFELIVVDDSSHRARPTRLSPTARGGGRSAWFEARGQARSQRAGWASWLRAHPSSRSPTATASPYPGGWRRASPHSSRVQTWSTGRPARRTPCGLSSAVWRPEKRGSTRHRTSSTGDRRTTRPAGSIRWRRNDCASAAGRGRGRSGSGRTRCWRGRYVERAPCASSRTPSFATTVFPPDPVDIVSRTLMLAAARSGSGGPRAPAHAPVARGDELRPRTRVPLYALAAGLGARSRRLAWCSAAWWVAARARELGRAPGPLRHRLAALPAELLVDVTTAGALVAGSARARTLVV